MTPIGGVYNRDYGGTIDTGFTWGPARITRMAWIEGRGRVVGIDTEHDRIQVFVSEKGRRIRVFRGNDELVALGEDTQPQRQTDLGFSQRDVAILGGDPTP